MTVYILRRLLQAVVVLFLVITALFFSLHALPTDEAHAVLGQHIPKHFYDDFNVANGLNRPLPVQYWYFLNNLFGHLRLAAVHNLPPRVDQNDYVVAYSQGVSLWSLVDPPLRNTLILAGLGYLVTVPLSVLLGLYMASPRRATRRRTAVFNVLSNVGYSLPPFVLAPVLLDLSFRTFGYVSNPTHWTLGNPFSNTPALIIPVVAISVSNLALYSRYLRSAVLDNLVQDYARTALAQGASERRLLFRHVLRNAAVAPVSLFPNRLAQVLSAQAIVEYQLGYPGIGSLGLTGALTLDFYTLIGSVLVVAVLVVLGSLLADIVLAMLDPRIRLAG